MILALKNYSHEYSRGIKALDVESFQVFSGERIALVGRNGSGKSTLLHALAGLFDKNPNFRVCNIASERTSLVFQSVCLDKKLSVKENLKLFGKVWGLSKSKIEQNLASICDTLNIADLLPRSVGGLSGGQQRRADLARALMSEPDVVFLDEPTTGLDVIAQREFWHALERAKMHSPSLTLICASHHGKELNQFDRFVFLEKGRIQLDVPRAKLLDDASQEAIEISSSDSSQLQALLRQKLDLNTIPLFNDKLISHTDNAADTLQRLKALSEFDPLVESVTVRRTTLSDIILKKLFDFSSEFNNNRPQAEIELEGNTCQQ